MSEAIKPDVKAAGLKILEKSVMETVDQIVKPYAEFYAQDKGGTVGAILLPFIDDLVEFLKKEVVDKIDGEDNI